MIELKTERLFVRPWSDNYRDAFAAMNADPIVMRYEPRTLSREESDARADEIVALHQRGGFGLCASESRATGDVLGFTVLVPVEFEAEFTPAMEIGWRLKPCAWHQGFATEAARAVAKRAFEALPLAEIVAFTVATNVRSRAVARRLGMRRDPAEDFAHPLHPRGSPLSRHVLYRLTADDFDA